MKIEKTQSMRITDLAGFSAIVVEPDDMVPGGVGINTGISILTIDGLEQVIGALTTALAFARTLTPETPAATRNEEGPWERIEDVPESVKAVVDKAGDGWTRHESGSWRWVLDQTALVYHQYSVQRYAPFKKGESA